MKKILPVFLAAMFALTMASCSGFDTPSDNDDDDSIQKIEVSVGPGEFNSKLTELISTPGEHTLTLTGSVVNFTGVSMNTPGVTLTLKGSPGVTISNAVSPGLSVALNTGGAAGPMFTVSAGTLIIENITLARGVGVAGTSPVILIEGGNVEVRNGASLTNKDSTEHAKTNNYNGVVFKGSGGTFIMSGGIIEKFHNGVNADFGSGNFSIAISGGIIRNNAQHAVAILRDSENGVVTITGGTFSGNGHSGIGINGNNHTVTMSEGMIIGNHNSGIGIWGGSGTKLTISGGEITGTDYSTENGVQIGGQNTVVEFSGGTISGFKGNACGVYMHQRTVDGNITSGKNNTFIMSGGIIENCKHGLGIRGYDPAVTIS